MPFYGDYIKGKPSQALPIPGNKLVDLVDPVTGGVTKTPVSNIGGGNPTIQTLTDGATITMNVQNGKWAKVTLGGNRTFTFTNLSNGDAGLIWINQDATGGRTLSWGSAIPPTGGLALSAGANELTVIGYAYENGRLVLSKENYGVSVPGDTTAPTVTSRVVENATPNRIDITYNETLDAGSVPANGAFTPSGGRTVTGVAIVGNQVRVTVNTPYANGDVITIAYTAGANPIQDAAGNDAANYSAQSVTNNIGTAQLATPSPFTATAQGADAILLQWGDVANEQGYTIDSSPNGSTGWVQIGTFVAGITDYTHSGLSASTQYFYRIKATGDGVNFSDSNYATANTTTGAASGILPILIIAGPAANQVAIFYKNKINFIGSNLAGRFTISGNSVAGVEAGDYVNVVRLNCTGNVSVGDTITFTPNGTDYLEHPTGDDLSAYTAQAIVATPGDMQPYVPAACIGGFSVGAGVELTFNKTPITADSISGFSFTRNGSPWAASSISYNSGTGKVEFGMATAAVAGETLQVSFNGNGTVRDSGDVVVATFTNVSISNGN